MASTLSDRAQPIRIVPRLKELTEAFPDKQYTFPAVSTFFLEITQTDESYHYQFWGETDGELIVAPIELFHQTREKRCLKLYGNDMWLNGGRFSVEVRIAKLKARKATEVQKMPFLVEIELFAPGFIDSISTAYMGIPL